VDSGLDEFSLTSPSVSSSSSRAAPTAAAQSLAGATSTIMTKPPAAEDKASRTPKTPTAPARSVADDYFGRAAADGGTGSAPSGDAAAAPAPAPAAEAAVESSGRGSWGLFSVAKRALLGKSAGGSKSYSGAAAAPAAKRVGSPLTTSAVPRRQRARSVVSDTTSVASVVSATDRATLLARAEALRAKARAEEAARVEMEEKRYAAVGEGRAWDAVALKVRRDQARERSVKLHRRAERRYLLGMTSLSSRCADATLME
jgi:hypothetical protein